MVTKKNNPNTIVPYIVRVLKAIYKGTSLEGEPNIFQYIFLCLPPTMPKVAKRILHQNGRTNKEANFCEVSKDKG
jgi:hypothetical protein